MLLTIEKLIYGGDGLARTPAGPDGRSMAVFVPFVLPGEQVEVELRQEKSGFARGAVTRVVEAAAERIEPKCPYFQQCGGCHYQHIPYERQLALKEQIFRETLGRVAKIDLEKAGLKSGVRLHASPPWNYRNRTRLQVRTAPTFALGYYRFASREFLPVKECPISSPLINRAMEQLTALGGLECPSSVEELELFADAGDEQMLGWAFCGKDAKPDDLVRWAEALRTAVPHLAGMTCFSTRQREEDESPAAVKEIAHSGAKSLVYRTKQGEYRVGAGAFFQVNRYLLDELVEVVTGNVEGEIAFDLYAGVGLFSVPMAQRIHHIFAVEASQTAVAGLRQNVPASVKVVGARTEEHLRTWPVRKRPDLVVLDPPRTGAGKAVTRSLVELGARRLRYVSCDPATLGRDLASLLAAGYRVAEAHLFDLFPQTFHIESVMLLER